MVTVSVTTRGKIHRGFLSLENPGIPEPAQSPPVFPSAAMNLRQIAQQHTENGQVDPHVWIIV